MNYSGYFVDKDGNKYFAGIVESGSNSNGSYIKFSDGTMICYLNITVTDQAIKNAYGSIFQGARKYTYPIPFSSKPSVTCTSFRWGTGASWGTVADISAKIVTLRGFDFYQREAGEKCSIGYIAIGRWK